MSSVLRAATQLLKNSIKDVVDPLSKATVKARGSINRARSGIQGLASDLSSAGAPRAGGAARRGLSHMLRPGYDTSMGDQLFSAGLHLGAAYGANAFISDMQSKFDDRMSGAAKAAVSGAKYAATAGLSARGITIAGRAARFGYYGRTGYGEASLRNRVEGINKRVGTATRDVSNAQAANERATSLLGRLNALRTQPRQVLPRPADPVTRGRRNYGVPGTKMEKRIPPRIGERGERQGGRTGRRRRRRRIRAHMSQPSSETMQYHEPHALDAIRREGPGNAFDQLSRAERDGRRLLNADRQIKKEHRKVLRQLNDKKTRGRLVNKLNYEKASEFSTIRAVRGLGSAVGGMALSPFGIGVDSATEFTGTAGPLGVGAGILVGAAIGTMSAMTRSLNERSSGPKSRQMQGRRGFSSLSHNATLNAHNRRNN